MHEGEISSLKRFKDDAKELLTGYEGGLGIAVSLLQDDSKTVKSNIAIELYRILSLFIFLIWYFFTHINLPFFK